MDLDFTRRAFGGEIYGALWLMFLLGLVIYGINRWRGQPRNEIFSRNWQRENKTSNEELHRLFQNSNFHQIQQACEISAGAGVASPASGAGILQRPEESVVVTPLEALGYQAALAPTKNVTLPSKRILLVDDDANFRQAFFEVLTCAGYQVDTAEDGEEGWKMLEPISYPPKYYDLLITDNQMPKMTGVDLIKKLRSENLTLPVILASGTAPTNLESLLPGVLLRKPFLPDKLVQTVKRLLPPPPANESNPSAGE